MIQKEKYKTNYSKQAGQKSALWSMVSEYMSARSCKSVLWSMVSEYKGNVARYTSPFG